MDGPTQDEVAIFNADQKRYAFGSAHGSTFNIAMCDGSVHTIGYNIDLKVHKYLANRKDGHTVQVP